MSHIDPHPGLTAEHAAVLTFETAWWKYAGAKETAIREQFAMSATDYYQLLNHLIDQPAALAYAPMLVRRLRRLRERRAAQRSAARAGRAG
ncbi:DUF3263 domain-containing protein [Nocardioides sp. AX2bis]|uniref:DUF3263 domain-containing protein n=1 Tax=Nocardioides sp. AX2bis TaxID=2653157 RepID=UPI0012F450F5|nr:DUF3263 domain-containing protein [Nocardioides sp. AX2bis]VXB34363.1 conserved hypothetical protein [Nocardioides sp. AX2bis]